MNRLLKVAVCVLTVVLVSLSGLMAVFVLGDGYFTAMREYPKQGRLLSLSDVPQDRSDRTLNVLLDAADTDVLLADEPTGALDHTLAQHVFDEMLSLHHEYGKTLIVVTHDTGIAQQCDRVLELQHAA